MTNKLSKSVKVKRSLCCDVSSAVLQYRRTGYTSAHSTLSSMQNVMVQFQKYPPIQGGTS